MFAVKLEKLAHRQSDSCKNPVLGKEYYINLSEQKLTKNFLFILLSLKIMYITMKFVRKVRNLSERESQNIRTLCT